MRHDIIEKIIEDLDPKYVAEFYGVVFNRRKFAICPFHREKTSSFTIKEDSKHYKCFGCGWYGNVIDFVKQYHGLTLPMAIRRISNDFCVELKCKTPTYQDSRVKNENLKILEAEKKFEETIHCEYLSLCEVRRILYGRMLNGEKWLEETVSMLDLLLDDFTGEEARLWEMALMSIRKTTL